MSEPSVIDQPRHWTADAGALAGFAALTALAGAGGALVEPGEWYATLTKPPGTPPNWAFPVVWTPLYVLMAVAAWLVWRRVGVRGGLSALVPFVGQLGANGLWSILFFGLQRPLLGMADLLVLWGLIVLTTVRFRRVSPLAAALLLPYLVWVSYAGYINAGVLVLNT